MTEVLVVDPNYPSFATLRRASDLLHQGAVVALPTETVYGLAANALDAAAVSEIYRVKGRPAVNPLIVHIADFAQLASVVSCWPEAAQRLADRFWPGPLTMILPKASGISDFVTGGGPTVGVRMPAHTVALELIRLAGLPLAAPSANRSTQLSPTRAEHVLASLGGRIPLILDGGPTQAGIESTVIDLTTSPPTLLRPGPIQPALLEEFIGPINRTAGPPSSGPLRSPGLLARHYAPRTPLSCVESIEEVLRIYKELDAPRLGLVITASMILKVSDNITVRILPGDAQEYAAHLYETLHELDDLQLHQILVVLPPSEDSWLAVRDRLGRAATKEQSKHS